MTACVPDVRCSRSRGAGETRGKIRPPFRDSTRGVEENALGGVDRSQGGFDGANEGVVDKVDVERLPGYLHGLIGTSESAEAIVGKVPPNWVMIAQAESFASRL